MWTVSLWILACPCPIEDMIRLIYSYIVQLIFICFLLYILFIRNDKTGDDKIKREDKEDEARQKEETDQE